MDEQLVAWLVRACLPEHVVLALDREAVTSFEPLVPAEPQRQQQRRRHGHVVVVSRARSVSLTVAVVAYAVQSPLPCQIAGEEELVEQSKLLAEEVELEVDLLDGPRVSG